MVGNIEKANPKTISASRKWCQPGSQMSNRKKKHLKYHTFIHCYCAGWYLYHAPFFHIDSKVAYTYASQWVKCKRESISHLLMQLNDCHIWQARSKCAHKTTAGEVFCWFAWQVWNATVCCWKWQRERSLSLLQNLQNYKWTTFPAWEKLQSTPFIGLQWHKHCLSQFSN